MMVVMAVMAEALHCNSKTKGNGCAVSNALLQTLSGGLKMDPMRRRLQIPVLLAAGLCLSFSGAAQKPGGAPSAAVSLAPGERIDINHASIEELLKVPGLTETWAARIVRFRPYRTKQDLVDKGVVTSEVYDRIKDYVIAHKDKQ